MEAPLYLYIPLASAGRLSCARTTTVSGCDRTWLVIRHTSTVPPFSGVTYSGEEKDINISVEWYKT